MRTGDEGRSYEGRGYGGKRVMRVGSMWMWGMRHEGRFAAAWGRPS